MRRTSATRLAALACCFLAVGLAAGAQALHDLQQRLEQQAAGADARVGIAVVLDGRDTLTVNNDARYPMMSVVKLHQAVAVADALERRGISPDTLLDIGRDDLRPDTYSPLRDKYPDGGVRLSVAELLEYTLLLSDNNACDILFREFGGPAATDSCLRGIGLRHFAVQSTEADMHRDERACYRNWTTPLEAVRLLEWLVARPSPEGGMLDFIRKTMTACRTGLDRLPAPLAGTGAVLGHKTGTGDRNAQGRIIGLNDVGFVFLPGGRRYTIAVLVRDSAESDAATARIIADVSEAVYRYAAGK